MGADHHAPPRPDQRPLRLPLSSWIKLVVAVGLALAAIALFPRSGGDAPPLASLALIGAVIAGVTTLALYAIVRRDLRLPSRAAASLAFAFVLIALVKFVLAPLGLYEVNAVKAFEDISGTVADRDGVLDRLPARAWRARTDRTTEGRSSSTEPRTVGRHGPRARSARHTRARVPRARRSRRSAAVPRVRVHVGGGDPGCRRAGDGGHAHRIRVPEPRPATSGSRRRHGRHPVLARPWVPRPLPRVVDRVRARARVHLAAANGDSE